MTLDYPTLEQIYQHVDRFAAEHARIARVESPGLSDEGLPVKAVFVTDPSVPDQQKQVALIVNMRHGNERGTRGVGPALLEWLASPEAAETLSRQLVVVVPVANPDGCTRDEFLAPDDGLSDTEARTIGALARRLLPDLVVDIHSMSDYETEAVIAAHTGKHGEDAFIHRAMMAKLVDDLATLGYPFLTDDLIGSYNNFFCGMCYEEFHAVVFGLEVNHLSLTCGEAAESGAAAVASLLRWGNARTPWQSEPGYPNGILLGSFMTSLRAAGQNAAERRRSRAALWRHRSRLGPLKRETSDQGTVGVTLTYDGEALDCPMEVSCRLRGSRHAVQATLNGSPVQPRLHADRCSTYVACTLPRVEPGTHELALAF
ncbi:MAG: hypothetical protein KAX44_04970 [Candidatus Brocadiae bacterium]|nr:hypothetical protein [Candidatus Brocadiia bacterium]